VRAVAVLPDGRVVTGGTDGRVLAWDAAGPRTGPAELGRHDGAVRAVAVLPDGRVVTGGTDGRVLAWDPARINTRIIQLSCSVTALAPAPFGSALSSLAIAHQGSGFSLWSLGGRHELQLMDYSRSQTRGMFGRRIPLIDVRRRQTTFEVARGCTTYSRRSKCHGAHKYSYSCRPILGNAECLPGPGAGRCRFGQVPEAM